MIFTPRALFQREAGRATRHGESVNNPEFQAAAHAALAQYGSNMPYAPDMGTAAAQSWKLQGAREFLNVLLTLHEPPSQINTPPTQGLNYSA